MGRVNAAGGDCHASQWANRKRGTSWTLGVAWSMFLATIPVLASAEAPRRLDEASLHDDGTVRLKLVRYHESLPLHYVGEMFTIQCASARTRGNQGGPTADPGWVQILSGGAIGAGTASEMAARFRSGITVHDETVFFTNAGAVSLSCDACASVRHWRPTSLPPAAIDPAQKPAYCRPKGASNCAFLDFAGPRVPAYEEIRLGSSGAISFIVRSKAIRGRGALLARTADCGRTWEYGTY